MHKLEGWILEYWLSFVNQQKFSKTFQSICDIVPCLLVNLLMTALVQKKYFSKICAIWKKQKQHSVVALKFVRLNLSGNLQIQQRPSIQSTEFLISYLLFTALPNSRFSDLNFLLNHLIRRSLANFISVLNISATANFLSFWWHLRHNLLILTKFCYLYTATDLLWDLSFLPYQFEQ